METRRFLGKIHNGKIKIEREEFYHIIRVLRYKVGDKFYAFNGDGFDYFCQIETIFENELIAGIIEKKVNLLEPRWKIALCVSLCKEFELIVQKAVELGVTEIQPFISSRTNVKSFKRQRLERILVDGVKQTGRAVIPALRDPLLYSDLLKKNQLFGNRIICYEKHEKDTFSSLLNWVDRDTMIIIGGEGGFTKEEIYDAKYNDFKIASLGKRILRVETAAIASIILVHNKYGSM